jgi:glyoxylase-like metal-dependent hydrolase (beta-lactamase superfamily II)
MPSPEIVAFFDEDTWTVSYVVADPAAKRCAVIDSVLDFDPASGRTATQGIDAVLAYVQEHGLAVDLILETHAHADHLSGAAELRRRTGAAVGIGAQIVQVQATFARLFNLGDDFPVDGRQFQRLFRDGDTFAVGDLEGRVMHTPGHTPACVTYCIGDAAFVGDTLFMPDYGTARADFPGGDAATLYRSIRRILALPPATRLFMCHDYKAPGRDEYRWETTVAAERAGNVHAHDGVTEDAFVAMRTGRDRTLTVPRLLLPSIQVNVRAGALPPPESNGIRYLKLPLNAL